MGIFDTIGSIPIQPKENVKEKELPKENKSNVFDNIKEIYNLINNGISDFDKIKIVIDHINDSDISFCCWLLNHYLVYHKFTRKFIDIIVKVGYSLDPKEYIKWYIEFMVANKFKFPLYMKWYKFNIDNQQKKYDEWLKSNLNLSDDDLTEYLEYKEISSRDLYLNSQYIY